MTDSADPATTRVAFELRVGDKRLRASVVVPAGPTRPRALLPVLGALADAVVGVAVDRVIAAGKAISCGAGCGACCRQLVPISESEAHHLKEVVEGLTGDRQAEILGRFAAVGVRLREAGLLDRLRRQLHGDLGSEEDGGRRALGMDYLHLGLPCPFLLEESCSIYEERPISCREYLVTSPPEACARPSSESVACVPLPARVSRAAAALDRPPLAGVSRWLPLVLFPEWTADHPEPPPAKSGPALLEEALRLLAGQGPC